MENHVSDGGAASVSAILPTGVGENGEIGICWDAMVKACIVNGIGGTIGIEFKSVVDAAAKVANERGESSEIYYHRGDACICKFADSKKDISACVVGEVKKSTHSGAEEEASLFCFTRLRSEAVTGQLSLLAVLLGGKGVLRSGNSEFGP